VRHAADCDERAEEADVTEEETLLAAVGEVLAVERADDLRREQRARRWRQAENDLAITLPESAPP
jgi:hypothetical protein